MCSYFSELVNECMQKVSGDKCKVFNPLGICTDMAGCNRQGLVNVYGSSFLKKFTACALHFKNSRNRHRMKLGTFEAKERFTYLTDALFDAVTKNAYCNSVVDLIAFIDEEKSRESLRSWVEWCCTSGREEMIFPAFMHVSNAPRSNLAEVVHASWQNMRESSLSLLDAAAFDTTQSFELDLQLKEFEESRYKGGTGPSAAKRVEKMRKQELEKTGKYADQIFQFSLPSSASVGKPSAAWSHVDPHDSHRADKRVSNDTNTNKAPTHSSQSRPTKLRPKKSQVIQKRIETAKKEEEIIKVKECQDVPAGRKYVIEASKSWLQKHPYEVLIWTKPICTCLDFIKAPNSGPCKHLIWLYLYIFHLKEDSHIIQQTSLTVDEVTKLLSVNDVENKYLAKKSTEASIVKKTGRFNFCKQLLQEAPDLLHMFSLGNFVKNNSSQGGIHPAHLAEMK